MSVITILIDILQETFAQARSSLTRLWKRVRAKQTTWVYCPRCHWELCAGGRFISDTERGVEYECEMAIVLGIAWNVVAKVATEVDVTYLEIPMGKVRRKRVTGRWC